MDTVDAVARAIAEEADDYYWDLLTQEEREPYYKRARAAIDALGLTEEWRCIGWVSTSTEKTAWLQHESNGGEVQSRLVSGWVRKDNTNE